MTLGQHVRDCGPVNSAASRKPAVWMLRCLVLAAAWLGLASCAWGESVAEEVQVGREVMAAVRRFGLTDDPTLTAIGNDLKQVVERKDLPWRFWVIEDLSSYNAFAAPGGFVFITRTYYEKLNDDEAAFVIGHEMAHVDLHHHERQSKRQHEAQLGNLLLNILTKRRGAWRTAVDVGSTAYMTHYSRALEKDADLAGYRYAKAAGYDARTAVTALSKLGEQPNLHPWIVNVYATHPVLSSREDRLAALGDEQAEEAPVPEPSASHARDLTQGLEPFDPSVAIAVRILAPEGGRWEDRRRKNFTKHLHLRLIPLGFEIAGDDIMYKPDIGDPVEAARSRGAQYLLLAAVHEMESAEAGPAELAGTPVRAEIDVEARLILVEDRSQVWAGRFSEAKEGWDVLPADPEVLYTDTCIGEVAARAAGEIALGCAGAAGAMTAESAMEEGRSEAAQGADEE